jgi:hypothetical protein
MTRPIGESDLVGEVAGWLSSGTSASEVERRLGEKEIEPEHASQLVDAALARQVGDLARVQRRKDRIRLICGVGLCVLGILLVAGAIIEVERFGLGMFPAGLAALAGGVMLLFRASQVEK